MDKLFTLPEVAERLGVHKETLKRYIREGRIKAIKYTARNFRISEKELNRFLKNK